MTDNIDLANIDEIIRNNAQVQKENSSIMQPARTPITIKNEYQKLADFAIDYNQKVSPNKNVKGSTSILNIPSDTSCNEKIIERTIIKDAPTNDNYDRRIERSERRIFFIIAIIIILAMFGAMFYLVYDDKFKSTNSMNVTVMPAAVSVPVTNTVNNQYNFTMPSINNTVIIKICNVNGTITNCP